MPLSNDGHAGSNESGGSDSHSGGVSHGIGSPGTSSIGTGTPGSQPGDFGHAARMDNAVGDVQGTFRGTIGEGRSYTYNPTNKPIPSTLDDEAMRAAALKGAIKGSQFGLAGTLIGGLLGYYGNQSNQLGEYGLGMLEGSASGGSDNRGEGGNLEGQEDPNHQLSKLLTDDAAGGGIGGGGGGTSSDLVDGIIMKAPSSLSGPTSDSGRGFLDMLLLALSQENENKNFNI